MKHNQRRAELAFGHAYMEDKRTSDSRTSDSRTSDARISDSRALDPRTLDPRALDPRTLDPRALDPRTLDPYADPVVEAAGLRDIADDAFTGLVSLGFSKTEARRGVQAANAFLGCSPGTAASGAEVPELASFLRVALQALRPPARKL